MCADVVGWDVSHCDWQNSFVSRAVGENARPADSVVSDGPCVARRRWKEIATLDFGKHTSPVSCCIYHKTAEIRQQSPTKVWFHDLWKRNGWNGLDAVWRVEFRLTREFLHAVGIESAFDLPGQLPLLWEYCAGRPGGADDGLPDGWLRYVVPSENDTTRSRWPVHPAWVVVQQAFTVENDGLGPLVRRRIREINIERGWLRLSGISRRSRPGLVAIWRVKMSISLKCCIGCMERVRRTWKRKDKVSRHWCKRNGSFIALRMNERLLKVAV